MQIVQIIIYGRNGERRVVALELNRVNIITGKSRTGKTALLDIIDFCLGRTTCNVADGVIRANTAWFALLLDLGGSQAFVARPNPDAETGRTNSDCVYERGAAVDPPLSASALQPNVSLDGLIDLLGQALGIEPNEHVPETGRTRPPLRANVKHAKLFCFQGQSEVASRDFLFHRQNDENGRMAQAIRDTLPYFLGAVPGTTLGHRQRLSDARKELRRLERDEEERKAVAGEAGTRAAGLLSEAAEVALADTDEQNDPLRRLQDVLHRGLPGPQNEPSGADAAEERRLLERLAEQRRRYVELANAIRLAEQFNAEEGSFEAEANRQLARLRVVEILPPDAPERSCPLCQSPIIDGAPRADQIRESVERLANRLVTVEAQRPRVSEHVADLRTQLADLAGQMRESRQRLSAIEDERSAAGLTADLRDRQNRTLGRISLYLQSVPQLERGEADAARTAELREVVRTLEAELAVSRVREKVESVSNWLGQTMTRYAETLKLEYAGSPYRLEFRGPTIIADNDGRPISMQQMGSAENWLGCHLIAHLALHAWFARKSRPVPRFLFIDQPTSAYYPPDTVEGAETDEDREAVARLYAWLIDTVEQASVGFQLLIVDHADLDDPRFAGRVVEQWRGDRGLIPKDWLT